MWHAQLARDFSSGTPVPQSRGERKTKRPLGERSAERRITGGIECYRVSLLVEAATCDTFRITSISKMVSWRLRLQSN